MAKPPSIEQRLQTLEDQNAIHRLIAKSCFLVDQKRLDLMASELFTEDALLDYGMIKVKGREKIHGFYTGYDGNLLGSAHVLTNVYIEIDDDTAKAVSYVQAWHWHTQAGETKPVAADNMVSGGYQDELVRTAEGWRIASRITVQFGTGIGAGRVTPAIRPVVEGMLGRLPTWPIAE